VLADYALSVIKSICDNWLKYRSPDPDRLVMAKAEEGLARSTPFKGTGLFAGHSIFGSSSASGKWTAKPRAGEKRRKFGL
jgi:hypothetical protein